jgi:glycine/D-amino acid oxidase-like deaminating enzyme
VAEVADVLVLGAGISGCALAHHLAMRGLRPTVYDPRTPSAGATGRSAGVLTEQLWNAWDVEVVRETRREYAELARADEPRAYRRNGFVRLASDPVAIALLDDAIGRWKAWGVEVEELTPAELSRAIPAGAFGPVDRIVHTPHDAVVDPSAIAATYAARALRAGAQFDLGRPTVSVGADGGDWVVATGTGTLRGRRLVVAAGAWSKGILLALDHPMPLAPYRTQAALLRPGTPAPDGFPTVHDLDTDVYLRPETMGRVLAGDGTEDVEANPEAFATSGDPEFLAHLAESVAARFPGWTESEVVGSWAGVCVATPDRRPIVGAVPGAPGLFVMAGFNGFGVMRAGETARRLADLIVDGPSAEASLAPVRPDRFSEPARPFRPRPGFTVEGGENPRF